MSLLTQQLVNEYNERRRNKLKTLGVGLEPTSTAGQVATISLSRSSQEPAEESAGALTALLLQLAAQRACPEVDREPIRQQYYTAMVSQIEQDKKNLRRFTDLRAGIRTNVASYSAAQVRRKYKM